MDVNYFKYYKKTKFSLVFFCLLFIFACKKQQEISNLKVDYKRDKAIAISFVSDSHKNLSIHLKGNLTSVLGDFSSENNRQTFTPIIPFSNGKTYSIKRGQQLISSFTIVTQNTSSDPELLAIYPTAAVVPENLLKMYFKFSQPMQEVGNVLDFISVFNKTANEKVDVFLELETELWNVNHTVLTVWLDPGRIKKDLVPNKERGLPILNGHEYEISISKDFRNAQGNPLKQTYTKTIKVKGQDKTKPKAEEFTIRVPKNETSPLNIQFNEPLDAILLTEVFSVLDAKGEKIEGKYEVQHIETSIVFKPTKSWKSGKYKIEIQSRLEDLAGNNLNRLFDEDLLNTNELSYSAVKEIYFVIK